MPESETDLPESRAHQFPTTHWSVVLAAGGADEPRAHTALSQLCQAYWYPLYAFVRRQGHGPQDAEDLTQGFFAHLLGHAGLGKARRAKGKFRTFLLASLRHFLANERERARAQKRGGGQPMVSLDSGLAERRFEAEAAAGDAPDQAYERNWALALMEQAMQRLTAEQEAAGKGARFGQLRQCLMGEPDAPGYAALAEQVGASVEAVRMAVCRLRQRYGQLLRDEIAQTVSGPAEVEEELRHLCGVWTA